MAQSLPTATGTFGEKPVLSFPETPAPEDLQVQVLEQGRGGEDEAG
ncbi:MAG TPA: peptidylprolyl isomerase, partial [Micrococcales bacterium]|nr:peptidylprolyl isomerase [Micrococcales bacterium]